MSILEQSDAGLKGSDFSSILDKEVLEEDIAKGVASAAHIDAEHLKVTVCLAEVPSLTVCLEKRQVILTTLCKVLRNSEHKRILGRSLQRPRSRCSSFRRRKLK